MTTVSLIAAMAKKSHAIGKNGMLPWHLPKDLKYFKENTLGKPIIMGRKTFESFGGKKLPKRPHIVVTRDRNYKPEGVDICHSLESAIDLGSMISYEVMIIGGGEIYQTALKYCNKIYLTEIDIDIEGDTFFPEFDKSTFKETARNIEEDNGIKIEFVTYEKTQTF